MFRNQYDNDVTVWSPQGRIHQLEYAMEAVKQGSACVGMKSKTHAILVALKRAPSELSAHQKKILPIDDHIAVSIAGLTADARLLCNYMRNECLNSRWAYNTPLSVSRLVASVGSREETKASNWHLNRLASSRRVLEIENSGNLCCLAAPESQIPTQRYGRRPFGVGLLVAGYDAQGPHIYQTCPSANYYDCKAMAIGARSQSARTYLEKHLDVFPDCSLDELVKHGLRALRDTLPQEVDLTPKNCSIGIVSKDTKFSILDDDEVAPFLAMIEGEERSVRPVQEEVGQPMEADDPPSGAQPDPLVAAETMDQ